MLRMVNALTYQFNAIYMLRMLDALTYQLNATIYMLYRDSKLVASNLMLYRFDLIRQSRLLGLFERTLSAAP